MTQSLKWVFRLIFVVVGFELAIVSSTIAGCFATNRCDKDTRDGIERTMNSLATKAFALYAAEKQVKQMKQRGKKNLALIVENKNGIWRKRLSN